MNWRHLWAFIWLRWRLLVNQTRRAGALSAILLMILVVGLLLAVIPLFVGSFVLGTRLIPLAKPAYLMYAWDGLVCAFLMFWCIGVITELQRNDPLSLSKFMHLPVSVDSAFLINYLSSLVRLSLILFVPAMLGFALALVYVQGFRQWAVLPGLAAFLLMVTAPTYQFQGWLASLVSNPRRRRTVIVTSTMAFILVFQLPNLVNLYLPRVARRNAERVAREAEEDAELERLAVSNPMDAEELDRRREDVHEKRQAEAVRTSGEDVRRLEGTARLVNMVLPVGWLPLCVGSTAEGDVAPALLGLAGMSLIGAGSLWRSYRATVAQYQGKSSSRPTPVRAAKPTPEGHPRGGFMEIRLPGVSETVSAVALASFRSVLRMPEAKMSLLTPIIMGVVFGSMLLNGRQGAPELFRPLYGFGAIAFVLFGLLQLMCNQFGIDRDGFRVFVLSAAPRRDILLGKNLSFVPPAFVLSAIMLGVVLVICPMRVDHALSMAPLWLSMFLMFCLMANLFSIVAPVYIAPGTLKPANPKMTTVLLQLALFFVLFPLSQAMALLPLGVEAGLNAFGVARGLPVCLLLSLAGCVPVWLIYRASLGWLGNQLQAREQRILETVTNRAV